MATGGKARDEREARERARVYAARQQLHRDQDARRRRDNLLAGVIGGVVLAAAIGTQTLYFTAGPGAPEPSPHSTSTPGSTPEPTPTGSMPAETGTPAPAESTPAP